MSGGGISPFIYLITQFLMVVSILVASGTAGPLLSMIKVFKMVYNLRLINVYFGNILEAFLQALSKGFGSNNLSTDLASFYFTKHRGKLSNFKISVLSNDHMYLSYLLIMFSQLLSIIGAVFKSKVKRAKRLDYGHLIMINVLDMVKTSIFYSSVYDVALFTVHELLHHDITIEQSSMAKVSYLFSVIVFLLTSFELVIAFHSLYTLRVGKLLKAIKLNEKIDKNMRDTEVDLKQRWKMTKAKERYQKEYNYIFGTSKMFFLVGIDLKKTNNFILRAIKMFSVFKTIFFSLIINSVQMMPGAQITIIMSIQFVYLVYIFWAVFKKKIFSNFFFGLVEIMSEVSILAFLLIGTLITYMGREAMSVGFSSMIQIIAIFMVLFATVVNLFYSVVVMVKSLSNIRQLLKYKNLKEAITKNYNQMVKLQKSQQEALVEQQKVNVKPSIPDPLGRANQAQHMRTKKGKKQGG